MAVPNQAAASASPPSRRQVFVDGRRAKKRETDRICQQRKRKRDRENLERLQERVELLQRDKEDMLLNSLIQDSDQNEARNIRHRTRLLQIKGLVEADLADMGFLGVDCAPSKSDNSATGNTPDLSEGDNVASRTTITCETEPFITEQIFSSNYLEEPVSTHSCDQEALSGTTDVPLPQMPLSSFSELGGIDFQSQTAPSGLPEHSPVAGANTHDYPGAQSGQASQTRQRSKVWLKIESLLDQTKSPSPLPSTDDNDTELDIHIIITAILRSWAQISKAVLVDAHWSCLRELDEKYFAPNSRDIDRLAILLVASQVQKLDTLQLLLPMGPNRMSLLPPFIKPRPSQLAFPHSTIADYYVWPGFRERLSLCHGYYNDDFLTATHTQFKFIWPHPFQDAYKLDPLTGLFHLSPLFLTSLRDIRCWTMDSDFFHQFPDFQGEVPVFNPGPAAALISAAEERVRSHTQRRTQHRQHDRQQQEQQWFYIQEDDINGHGVGLESDQRPLEAW